METRQILIDALIKLVMALIGLYLVPMLKDLLAKKKDNEELQTVLKLAEIAVKSIENDLATESGEQKKQEALTRLADLIAGWGITGFNKDELDHYIETAVKNMWNNQKTP